LVLGYAVLWTTEDEETMQRHERQLITDTPPEVEEPPVEDLPVEEDDADDDAELSDDDEPTIVDDGQENKYNLDEFGTPEDEEEEPEEQPTNPISTRRHLTAKQRRDLKKGKPLDSPAPETTNSGDDPDSGVEDVTATLSTTSLSKQKPPVRGKRGKAKKIKAKYADQSDEERELARKLLGGPKSVEPKPEEPPVPVPVKNPAPPPPARPPKPPVEEPLEALDLNLKEFIAAPKPGDLLTDAVTVCAPWSALTRFKFKVKLTPGSTKKGKAARAAVGGFLAWPVDENDGEKMSPREKELLASLKGISPVARDC
jgi:hypothetical protein